MGELAADGVPVAVTCRVLRLARQPYDRWPTGLTRSWTPHRDDSEFGYRFLVDEARTAGEVMAEWNDDRENRVPLVR